MSWLRDNPILVAQWRLVLRTGHLVPACVVFTLIYLIILVGSTVEQEDAPSSLPMDFRHWHVFWILLVQGVAWVVGSFSKISREVQEDIRDGMMDFHRISPLSPGRILLGYMVGAPVREWLLGALGALATLVVVVRGELPLANWLILQGLMFSSAVLAQLVGAFVGQTLKRRGPVVMGALGFVLLMMPNSIASGSSLLNFVVPSAALTQLFAPHLPWQVSRLFLSHSSPAFFGVTLDPLLFTWLVQAVLGLLIGRAVYRRIRAPESPALSRAEALGLFLFVAMTQFGLIAKPQPMAGIGPVLAALSVALGAGGMILFGQTAQPWRLRKMFRHEQHERGKGGELGTAVGWAVVFTVMTVVLVMVALSRAVNLQPTGLEIDPAVLLLAASIGAVFIGMVLVIESFRLWLARRSSGFQGLALFVMWVLPLMVSALFDYRMELVTLSPLAIPILLLRGLATPWWLETKDIVAICTGLTVQWAAVLSIGALWWWQRRKLRGALSVEREV